MKKFVFVIFITIFVIAGCTNKEEKKNLQLWKPKPQKLKQ